MFIRVVALWLSFSIGCAAQMSTLPNNWNGKTDPKCDASYNYMLGDLFWFGLNGVVLSAAASADSKNTGLLVAASAIGGLVFAISAGVAGSNAHECALAYGRIAAAKDLERQPPAPPTVIVQTGQAPSPRGFYCATSPTVASASLCAREKSTCQQARGLTVGAVPDLGECSLTEHAFCFDAGSGNPEERCATTEDACKAQRDSTPNAKLCEAR